MSVARALQNDITEQLTSDARGPTDVARRAAMISITGMGAFIALVLVLHAIKPELEPSWRFISEYSIGRLGWIMSLAFFCWALSCLALFVSLREEVVTLAGQIGRFVLLAVGLALVVAGLFAQDPVTATPDQHTAHGTVHALASLIGIPGIAVAALLISTSLSRHNPDWRGRRRIVVWTAHLTWLSLLAMVTYLGVAVPQAGGFGPRVLAGWMNRLVVLMYCVWQIAASYHVLRVNGRAARC